MKKRITILLAALAILAMIVTAANPPALAAWIGTIWAGTTIEEPFDQYVVDMGSTTVFPGQEYQFIGQVENKAPVAYGIKYDPWAFYIFSEMGKGGMSATAASAGAPPEEKREIKILPSDVAPAKSPKAMAGGMGGPEYIGKFTMHLDPDGDGPAEPTLYKPDVITYIPPGGVHRLHVSLAISHDAYPGEIRAYVQPYRTAPPTAADKQ